MGDDWGRTAHPLLLGLIAGLAWLRARHRSEHQLVVGLFGWELVANGLRLAIAPLLESAPVPGRGPILVAYSLDQALVLSHGVVLVTVCDRHFLNGPWPRVPIVGLALWIGLVLYHQVTGGSLVPVHCASAAGTAGLGWLMVGRAALAPDAELRAPDGVHAIFVLILAAELVHVASLCFDFREATGPEVRTADLVVHAVVLVGYLAILCREGAGRWRASRS